MVDQHSIALDVKDKGPVRQQVRQATLGRSGDETMTRPKLVQRIVISLIGLAALLFSTVSAQATTFLASAPDFPVMPGLEEEVDRAVVFDKPTGRIIEAYVKGQAAGSDILTYYARTLPQFGWQAEEKPKHRSHYKRAGEKLTLTIFDLGHGQTRLQIRIEPA